MDTLEVLLPEVLPAKFRRVCGRINPALGVGTGFLRVTEGEGEKSSGGGAGVSLQMDTDHLEVLADENEV